MMGMGLGLGGLGLIIMLVFLVVVIALAVWLVSNLFPRATATFKRSNSGQHESSLEILKQRFARGEISRVEYDEMHEVLQSE